MLNQFLPALRMMVLFTIVTGLIYPGVVTVICQTLFKHQADGSLITENGQIIGSALLGQNFTKPGYFHLRPSAAGPHGYDASASGGSNLGPTNRKLYERVQAAAVQFRKDNPTFQGSIPADALTTSGSGLDPEISIANANAQAPRVAKARDASLATIQSLIASATEGRGLGFLGEPGVNVLKLNLALDKRLPGH